MLTNGVDSTKREGTGKNKIKILASSPMQREQFECDGKYIAGTLDFGLDNLAFILSKYDKNTEKDVEKRLAKRKSNNQGLSH